MGANYQVLARKYRPQAFSEVVGQEPVVRTLTNALSAGRVHHAYVFSGIRGVGKTTSARLLARALNCENGPTGDPCGTCPACTEITAGRSIDSIEIDAASNRGIDEIKALIQNAQYAPSRDRYKVFIIDEFHMLTREAFNALLKTLEEPPPHVVFVLATTELEKVPATILSRCLLLSFRPVAPPQVRDHLLDLAGREGVSLDPAAADLLVRKAGGSMRDAQSTLDRVIALAGETIGREAVAAVLGLVDARELRALLAAALEGRTADALQAVGAIAESGADLQGSLDDLVAEARSALLAKVLPDGGEALGLPASELEGLRELAKLGSEDDLRRLLEGLLEAGPRLRHAVEPRYVLEALVVRLAQLTRLEPLATVLNRLEDMPEGPPPAVRRTASLGAAPAASTPTAAAPAPAPEASGAAAPEPSAAAVVPAPVAAAPVSVPPEPAAPAEKGWRDRVASAAAEPEPEEVAPAPPPPPVAAADTPPLRGRKPPPKVVAAADPLACFHDGLPARVRARVEDGVMSLEGEGLAILMPPERASVIEDLEVQRFHLMGAAAVAFGRPVPVLMRVDEGLLDRKVGKGELAGTELEERQRDRQASANPAVAAVVRRFEGSVTEVSEPGGGDAGAS
jgi:DNA polymerase-3 subunit gamma/tau